MNFKKYPSLARASDALSKKGFTKRFSLKNGKLKLKKEAHLYDPAEVAIVEYHRFKPKDQGRNSVSIVVALETNDGIKGLLVSTYNAYGKVALLEFMDRVKIKSNLKLGR